MPIPAQPTNKPWTLKHLWERHHQIKRLALLGFSNKDIAAQIGLSEVRVSIIRNSPVFVRELNKLSGRADDRALDLQTLFVQDAHKNYALLAAVRDGELTDDVRVRVQVAQDLLDRSGHSKVQRIEGRFAHAHLDAEALERIKNMAKGRREAHMAIASSE